MDMLRSWQRCKRKSTAICFESIQSMDLKNEIRSREFGKEFGIGSFSFYSYWFKKDLLKENTGYVSLNR